MPKKLTLDDRMKRMTDDALPQLCRAIRDALPSIDSDADRNDFLPMDLDMIASYKRISTVPYETLTHASNIMTHYDLNAAGKGAMRLIETEISRRREAERKEMVKTRAARR